MVNDSVLLAIAVKFKLLFDRVKNGVISPIVDLRIVVRSPTIYPTFVSVKQIDLNQLSVNLG